MDLADERDATIRRFDPELGIAMAQGREFEGAETRQGGPQSIILSLGVWRDVFESDPGAYGRIVRIDNTPYTVVGVLPAGAFHFHNLLGSHVRQSQIMGREERDHVAFPGDSLRTQEPVG